MKWHLTLKSNLDHGYPKRGFLHFNFKISYYVRQQIYRYQSVVAQFVVNVLNYLSNRFILIKILRKNRIICRHFVIRNPFQTI